MTTSLQIYCAALALVTAILPRLRLLKTHLSVLLLAAFLLAAYRNLLPLALGRKPLDIVLHHLKGIHDPLWDTLVWLRVGLLGLAGVVLPLILLLRCTFQPLLQGRSTATDPLSYFRFVQLPRIGIRFVTTRSPSSGTGRTAPPETASDLALKGGRAFIIIEMNDVGIPLLTCDGFDGRRPATGRKREP